MKTLKVFLTILFAAVFSISTNAQSHDHIKVNVNTPGKNTGSINSKSFRTENFRVSGNCSMCKARIEKAGKSVGASSASWDSKTKIMTVTFDPSKSSREAISKKIASAGHDTEKDKASDEVYAKLPGCCHYERSDNQ